jgi:signal transduction histidine kinase
MRAAASYRCAMDTRALIRRYGDVLLAAVLAVLMVLELLSWVDDDLARSIGVGLLATLPLVVRRRNPIVSFLLVMLGLELLGELQRGFDNDSMSFVVVFFLALYSVGRHATGVEAWLGGVGLVVTMLFFLESEGGGGLANVDLGDLAFVLVFVGAPWAAGLALRLKRERETTLGAENERLRREQELRAQRAVAEERSRIARELHDVVSHAISVTVLQARGARRTLDTDPETARRALDAIEQTNTAALGDMRRLLAVLRDTEADGTGADDGDHAPQPSLEHLPQLVGHVRESGVPVDVTVRGTPQSVPPGVDLSAYRIVQEALTNVLKHARQAEARVLLEYGEDALGVTVSNNGVRVPNEGQKSGHGLIGIRERVAVVGGDVTAGPLDAGGFEIRARLPYSTEVL